MDLAERLADVERRNEQSGGVSDDEAKERFLELLSEGLTVSEAGKQAGRSATWFRRRRNPDGSNYDEAFSEAFQRATGENRAAIVEDVFTAMVKAAKEGNVRAQEKILAAYSEEFSFMKPQIAQGPVNVEQLQVFFGELPLSKLLELKEARDAARLPVLDQ